jgi:myosin heavy subunit
VHSRRYARNEIYTFVGPILISVNPYTPLPLYSKAAVADYASGRATAPHLFSVAHCAFHALKHEGDQVAIYPSAPESTP